MKNYLTNIFRSQDEERERYEVSKTYLEAILMMFNNIGKGDEEDFSIKYAKRTAYGHIYIQIHYLQRGYIQGYIIKEVIVIGGNKL
jgi:hypothetical protein